MLNIRWLPWVVITIAAVGALVGVVEDSLWPILLAAVLAVLLVIATTDNSDDDDDDDATKSCG